MTMKHVIQERLSMQADGGVLVEVGVATGEGLRSMWAGTRYGRQLPIYGIDPYVPFRDLLGHEYDASSKAELPGRIGDFAYRVYLIEEDALTAAEDWTLPIALLWLDLSLDYDRLKAIIDAFVPHVIPGGLVAVTGLEYGALGTQGILAELPKLPGWQGTTLGDDTVAVLRKSPPRRAVFYIAQGDQGRYVMEACRSACSVRENLGVETFLFTPEAVTSTGVDHVIPMPPRKEKLWYLDNVHYFRRAVEVLSFNHEQLLYLDVDTRVCVPCDDLWLLLNQYDLALGHSASRDCVTSAVGCPASFPTFQVGVNLFTVNERTLALFTDWERRYKEHAELYDDNDEAPLRDTLWENRAGIKWMCLAPEYCLRFDFGTWLNGKVRILHGRVGGRSQPDLKDVADEINSITRMRLWDHGLVQP